MVCLQNTFIDPRTLGVKETDNKKATDLISHLPLNRHNKSAYNPDWIRFKHTWDPDITELPRSGTVMYLTTNGDDTYLPYRSYT